MCAIVRKRASAHALTDDGLIDDISINANQRQASKVQSSSRGRKQWRYQADIDSMLGADSCRRHQRVI